jgi:gas vesicle protein GvpA/GvpJ/GvpM family
MSMGARPHSAPQSTSIVDILDRVLDKGLVVAGDISISLANVELLTIRIRLLVCSIDKAEQIGLNWWRYDKNLVAPGEAGNTVGTGEIRRLESRIADLERTLQAAASKKSV